jgi:hypothetical protein
MKERASNTGASTQRYVRLIFVYKQSLESLQTQMIHEYSGFIISNVPLALNTFRRYDGKVVFVRLCASFMHEKILR